MKTLFLFNRKILFVVLLVCTTFRVSSQKVEPNQINKFSTEQDLSSNIIYTVLQDPKGFIWIATEEGLNKFDGKSFTHFSTNSGRYSVSHNRTQTLILAPDGNIWTGTSDGLNIYDYRSDSIIKVRKNTSPLKLVFNDITFLTTNVSKTKIWIGTYGDGVNYFDWAKRKFYALSLPNIKNIPPPLFVRSLLEDDNGRLWIGTQHNGLYRYDLIEKRLNYYPLPYSSLFIRTIYQDNFRRIWIGTSKGCYLFNETTNQLDLINYPSELATNSIGAIKEDHAGRIWIGTEQFLMNFSVRSFSLKEKFLYQLISQGESSSRLSCSSINSLYADRDNNIWIGTAWGGVNMLKGTPTKFKLFKHNPESANSLPNSPINAICTDNKGSLVIATMGTDKVGVCKMNLQNGEIKELELNKKLPGYIYQSALFDSQNNLWLGTYNKGLLKANQNNSSYKQFQFDTKNPGSIPGNDVRAIYEGKDKTIWIGTNNGLAKYDAKSQQIYRIEAVNRNAAAIRSIKESANGTLWLGTYGAGVITYNYKTQKVNSRPTTLAPHVITDMLICGDSVWMGSQGEGLFLYNQKNKRSVLFTELNGLPSNYVSSLTCDNTKKIWIGTSKGISRLDPGTKEIENFSSGDGIQNREFSAHGAISLPNGLMAFGGFGGLNLFNPLEVTKNDKCPSVIFTKLLVSNELITPSENKHKNSPLKENITLADKIVLSYNQSVFTIEFMGVNYNANQKIQYAYFLEGSDKKWNHLGTQNSVTFRNLQPGEYVFKVKASSPDAVWSDKNIASIEIIIKPPFWKTYWAYFIYLIILAAILYFVWVFFTTRIRAANNLKIERAKRENDEELHQEKLQFFTNISHEFRTPLTLIIGPLEKILMDETEEEKKVHLKLMLRNAKRLLGMVNQLLDFRKAERGQFKLKVQHQDLINNINEIMILFDELKTQKNISLEFIHEEQSLLAWFDADFLNKSLFNLLSNAFKFTPNGGCITLSVCTTKDLLDNKIVEISLTDNGKGILPKDINNIFKRFYQGKEQGNTPKGSGIGLHLTKSLIELHHGTIEVESTPNVKTTFRITLPIERSAYLEGEFMDEAEIESNRALVENVVDLDLVDTEKAPVEKPKSQNKKRILIVEDNEDIRSYIHSILGMDYEIQEAENGAVALEMVALNEYHLIISDLMMPEMDGIEMCQRLKGSIETDHIPIIILTAKSEIEDKIEGLKIGADSYITKPFHPEHLIIRVSKLIELRELLKERYSHKISLGDLNKPNLISASPDELFLQKTISIILDKMVETEFNGDALAYELGISRMGLHRKIKALTGQSTGEFIRNIRLKKSCELLSTQGKNISEVCYDVGFNSPSYFTTCFTEAFKMTPSEYVKSLKNTATT
jgi:signal transduction histidine kinase/ligand-binding sensor domain-containing protein/DNA-binding NarL/FixJ family response regulator